MAYLLTQTGHICLPFGENAIMHLPPEDNGTPEWAAYKTWLEAGNTPEPAPEPEPVPELTPAEKLANAGLSIDELKGLLGL